MPGRTIEDRLREEYFDLLPDIRRVGLQLEAEIKYHTLPILQKLTEYEQLVVRSRVKDCESAIKALRRRQEGRTFDPDKPEEYSVLNLPDLAGARVLVFPQIRLIEIDDLLRGRDSFTRWASDPVKDGDGTVLALKYNGYFEKVSEKVRAEYQVVPMLIGLFWEVEHSAIYKPALSLKGIAESEEIKKLKTDVERALSHFEAGFESFVRENIEPPSEAS
jgi:ppGpp synthetase/RelA/SpoT-type nucleotidyltranferase